MIMTQTNNLAFIDAQNLYFGTTKCTDCAVNLGKELKDMKLIDCVCGEAWEVDLAKFRTYLKENYSVSEAYYFMGITNDNLSELYLRIQKAGFILYFREHTKLAKSSKKGNVDTDIVFEIMKNVSDNKDFDRIYLVSGDGDYMRLVSYLIEKGKFGKVLFPNRRFASSLYKQFGSEHFDYLDNIKTYISR